MAAASRRAVAPLLGPSPPPPPPRLPPPPPTLLLPPLPPSSSSDDGAVARPLGSSGQLCISRRGGRAAPSRRPPPPPPLAAGWSVSGTIAHSPAKKSQHKSYPLMEFPRRHVGLWGEPEYVTDEPLMWRMRTSKAPPSSLRSIFARDWSGDGRGEPKCKGIGTEKLTESFTARSPEGVTPKTTVDEMGTTPPKSQFGCDGIIGFGAVSVDEYGLRQRNVLELTGRPSLPITGLNWVERPE